MAVCCWMWDGTRIKIGNRIIHGKIPADAARLSNTNRGKHVWVPRVETF